MKVVCLNLNINEPVSLEMDLRVEKRQFLGFLSSTDRNQSPLKHDTWSNICIQVQLNNVTA